MIRNAVAGCVLVAVGLAGQVLAEMEIATPESQGVSSRGVMAWLDACERTFDAYGRYGAVHGFVLVRHGKVVAAGSWKPFETLKVPHMLYSHSKSFTSTAVGLAVDDGLIDLDERIVDIFTNERPNEISKNLSELRVRDLLTMNVGKKDHILKTGGDWLMNFMAQDFTIRPGSRFRYDSDATYMLAAIVEKRTGRKMMDFLKERFFDKIGIVTAWSTCSPQGIACGGWGMNMTTPELARFGLLYLQEGVWGGERVISSEWVRLATARQTWCNGIVVHAQTIGSGSDWKQGYGFQFWRCRHGAYRADGASGQLTVVMPDRDAVLSVHAGLDNMQAELDLIWQYVLPALGDRTLPENPVESEALKKRCANLAICPIGGVEGGSEKYCATPVALKGGRHEMSGVRLEKVSGGWICRLTTSSGEQAMPVGFGEWRAGTIRIDTHRFEALGDYIGEFRTVGSGAVLADGSFHLRIYMIDTTSWIDLVFKDDGGKVWASGTFRGMGGCEL